MRQVRWACPKLAPFLSFLGNSKAMEAASSAYYNPANPHSVYMPMVSAVPVCARSLFRHRYSQEFAFLVKPGVPSF